MVIGLIMPKLWYDPALEKYVLMAAIPWCIAEFVRYPFYQFKGLQAYLGHLRYNLFIVLYPVGVTGELLCFY
jgi:very-long-chain (3R)-3-hydroxyacyl-CoA dehydratase